MRIKFTGFVEISKDAKSEHRQRNEILIMIRDAFHLHSFKEIATRLSLTWEEVKTPTGSGHEQ